jgi:exocyst complex component 2
MLAGVRIFMLTLATAQSGGKEVWQAILDLVKQVSETMLSALPHFWRIATDFTSGKLKKVRCKLFESHKC